MEPLVEGIYQCPQCKKITKLKDKETEAKEKKIIEEGAFQDGEFFHKNVSLNKQYEICEKGITIDKTQRLLICQRIAHRKDIYRIFP